MESSLVLLAMVIVLGTAAFHVVDGDDLGFSIDCGLPDKYSAYTDPNTGNYYEHDEPYVDGAAGENQVVAAAAVQAQAGRVDRMQSLRSFPTGTWNCYTFQTQANSTYLVRAQFAYGNYDRQNSSKVEFELHLGSKRWDTVTVTPDHESDVVTKEAVFLAWASWAPVCLVNTGGGTPFVSVIELRRLGDGRYPPANKTQSLSMYLRLKMGTDVQVTRHPSDEHDRLWSGMTTAQLTPKSTTSPIEPDRSFDVSSPILQTAVTATAANKSLTVVLTRGKVNSNFMAFLHFADFQNTQFREFDIYVNDIRLGGPKPYRPLYLQGSCVYSSEWYTSSDGEHNITLVSTATSELPPILNALEIYTMIDLDDVPSTYPQDCELSIYSIPSRTVQCSSECLLVQEIGISFLYTFMHASKIK
ncbi:unnamed protein product [Urochloa humidicola]